MPGIPFTKVVPGNDSNSITFEVPAWFAVDLESVLARVDASGAGDTTATLTVADETGEQVATVPQGRVIAGGATGRATWALRLAAEQAPATGASGIQFDVDNIGGFLRVFATGHDAAASGILLVASDATQGRILLESSSRDVEVRAGRDINLIPQRDFVAIAGGDAILRAGGTGVLSLRGIVDASLNCTNGGITIRAQGGETAIVLSAGNPFTIYDSLGSAIFRVDESGDLHGLTGKSLTFDL